MKYSILNEITSVLICAKRSDLAIIIKGATFSKNRLPLDSAKKTATKIIKNIANKYNVDYMDLIKILYDKLR